MQGCLFYPSVSAKSVTLLLFASVSYDEDFSLVCGGGGGGGDFTDTILTGWETDVLIKKKNLTNRAKRKLSSNWSEQVFPASGPGGGGGGGFLFPFFSVKPSLLEFYCWLFLFQFIKWSLADSVVHPPYSTSVSLHGVFFFYTHLVKLYCCNTVEGFHRLHHIHVLALLSGAHSRHLYTHWFNVLWFVCQHCPKT